MKKYSLTGIHQKGAYSAKVVDAPAQCHNLMGIKTCMECPLDDCHDQDGLERAWREYQKSQFELVLSKMVGTIKVFWVEKERENDN